MNSHNISITKDEDLMFLDLIVNSKTVGYAELETFTYSYWYFDGILTEAEFDELFPNGNFIAINRIVVNNQYRGNGYGRILLTSCISKAAELGIDRIYLNACPLLGSALDLQELVEFYNRYGFETLSDDIHNVQMIKRVHQPVLC